jgi:hypothetical protein
MKRSLGLLILPFLIASCFAQPVREEIRSADDRDTDYLADEAYEEFLVEEDARQHQEWAEQELESMKATDAFREKMLKEDFGDSGDGCPNGCTTHKSRCDIKGNISYNTKEKIYPVPGQNFYNETKISPEYGERWFCTEAEAKANGWRKAKN